MVFLSLFARFRTPLALPDLNHAGVASAARKTNKGVLKLSPNGSYVTFCSISLCTIDRKSKADAQTL